MKKLMLILSILVSPALMVTFLPVSAFAAAQSGLGDLSSFESIASDTLGLVAAGDMKAAEKRITDFETAWDKAEPKLYAADKAQWGTVDDAADAAIKSLRTAKPNAARAKVAVEKLIAVLRNPAAK